MVFPQLFWFLREVSLGHRQSVLSLSDGAPAHLHAGCAPLLLTNHSPLLVYWGPMEMPGFCFRQSWPSPQAAFTNQWRLSRGLPANTCFSFPLKNSTVDQWVISSYRNSPINDPEKTLSKRKTPNSKPKIRWPKESHWWHSVVREGGGPASRKGPLISLSHSPQNWVKERQVNPLSLWRPALLPVFHSHLWGLGREFPDNWGDCAWVVRFGKTKSAQRCSKYRERVRLRVRVWKAKGSVLSLLTSGAVLCCAALRCALFSLLQMENEAGEAKLGEARLGRAKRGPSYVPHPYARM